MTWQASLSNLADTTGPVSHELHNAFNGIVLQVALLSRKVPDGCRDDLAELRSLALRADRMLAHLDAYRHELRPPVGEVDLGALATAAAGRLNAEGVPVEVKLPGSRPVISGDESDADRLIWLLARNAHRGATSGGSDGAVTVKIETDAEVIRLTVQDNGPKAARERLTDFFDPFTPPRPGENSLERAVCHVLATRLGGTIRAANRPRRGLSVVAELPADGGST